MAITVENEQERSRRRRQRTLFNGVAQLYQATRPSYPSEMVEFLMATAGVGPGSAVLEVGCGTGQLTQDLARYGFDLTAIDIGPAMIAAARRHVDDSAISFQVSSFEDFASAGDAFDLIVSATAFHWIDPEIKFTKPARLLRPGGWLALLATGEHYDEPLDTALHAMWVARTKDQTSSARKPPTNADAIIGSGLFDHPVDRTHQRHTTIAAETIIGVENTRATSLSWSDDVRQGFTAELRSLLGSLTEVPLTLHTSLTMARLR